MGGIAGVLRRTCAVSAGSQISNRRNRAHSVPLMRCFWSAFLAENVCAVMCGQSSWRSKSSNRRFVTNSLMSEAGIGLGGSRGAVFVLAGWVGGLGAVFVFRDWVRAWPGRVEAAAAALEACEVGRDMVAGPRAT